MTPGSSPIRVCSAPTRGLANAHSHDRPLGYPCAWLRLSLHRPDRLGNRRLRRMDGDELAADILQQHRVGVVVLAHLIELDAPPGHDGLFARNIGCGERLTDLRAVGRL